MLNEMQLQLLNKAREVQKYRKLDYDNYAGYVGCAMLGANGKIYTGIDIGVTCGIGFCAEHTCISQMIMDGETRVLAMCAVGNNTFFPPCGRCRELLSQVNRANKDCEIILGYDNVKTLEQLLPYPFWTFTSTSERLTD
ncbi:MAG: cytidine deaminase [Clostridia bacterium]|nr:cytidine deaminase [Clostridia bacterium]